MKTDKLNEAYQWMVDGNWRREGSGIDEIKDELAHLLAVGHHLSDRGPLVGTSHAIVFLQ